MQIIPVIDIKSGHAVLAKQGQRKNYQPLSTALCSFSEPAAVIEAYLNIWNFKTLYIADIDSLMGTGNNTACINTLFKTFPEIEFMVDCGVIKPNYQPLKNTQHIPVLGTESFDSSALKSLEKNFILSLDFATDNLEMGKSILYNSPELWPKKLIIMTLALVGKNCGADLQKIKHYLQHYPNHNFIAAGGIRDLNDVMQLKNLGIQQALVASALHNRQIKKEHCRLIYQT
ncbi:MAG: HisA/HisF-related TIM barrel protein [Methyloprofundus sp.]|nr:HisA/HisF-related TIM barrel protein [Methyloprofundus sp.]